MPQCFTFFAKYTYSENRNLLFACKEYSVRQNTKNRQLFDIAQVQYLARPDHIWFLDGINLGQLINIDSSAK